MSARVKCPCNFGVACPLRSAVLFGAGVTRAAPALVARLTSSAVAHLAATALIAALPACAWAERR
eukprot:2848435-Pleurochrysis_carterae.AAC.1